MRSTPSALKTHMQGSVTTLATLWKIQRTDGTVLGFTNHDKSLTVSSVDYEPIGGADPTAIASSSDTAIDNLDVKGSWVNVITSNRLTPADLRAGLYDHAELWIYRVNWESLSDGVEIQFYGRLGKVHFGRSGYKAEVQDLTAQLHQTVGDATSATCRAELGDSACGVVLKPSAWQASVAYAKASNSYDLGDQCSPTTYSGKRMVCEVGGTSGGTEPTWPAIGNTVVDGGVTWRVYEAWTKEGSVTGFDSRSKFYDTSRTEDDNWFRDGKVTWTSGLNTGFSMEVKRYIKSTGLIELMLPMPYDIAASDNYEMHAGCNHLRDLNNQQDFLGDCKVKFNNVHNIRAEPDCTGDAKLIQGGGSGP